MQRLLAIDCDARELCFVLASAVGERVTLEAAEVISFARGADDPPASIEELGKRLQVVLAKYKKSGVKVLAAVDRSAVDIFELTLPPASDSELPAMVLNQVTMESAAVVEESVIDFISRSDRSTEPRAVTAAALSRTELSRVNAICNSAGITPDRMLMRSYATATLFLSRHAKTGGNSLLVNIIGDEVDLIVVDRVQPLFFRTVRLPGGLGTENAETRLLHEVRRTLLVAPQSGAETHAMEFVYIFGNSPDHDRMVEQISRESSIKVELFDPYAGFLLGSEWGSQTSGRLIPLLGMLVAESSGAQHAMDFLHPRRPPKPPNRIRQLAVSLTMLSLVGGAGAYYLWENVSTADAENKRLAEELSDLEGLVKKTAEKKKAIDAIDDWLSNSVIWLDELRDLSSKFPSGQDLALQRLTMSPARGGRASIAFQALAREPNVVTRMEASLRDARHEVQTPRVDERIQDKSYTWNFETTVSLTPAKFETEMPAKADKGETTPTGIKKKTLPKVDVSGTNVKSRDELDKSPSEDVPTPKATSEKEGS